MASESWQNNWLPRESPGSVSYGCLVRRLGEGHHRPEHPRESFPGANLADFLAAAHKSS